MSILVSLIAGLSTIIGGLVIFLKNDNKDNIIVIGLSLAAGAMITLSVFELLPISIYDIYLNNDLLRASIISVGMFEIGFLLVFLSNKLVGKGKSSLYKIGFLNMITLMIHNFPEGILTFVSTYNNYNIGVKIALSIMIHNIPEGISIAIPIYYSTGSRGRALFMCFISCLSEVFGALLCFLFINYKIDIINMNLLYLIIAGLMISLSLFKIIPEANKYNNKRYLLFGFIIGVVIMSLSILFF